VTAEEERTWRKARNVVDEFFAFVSSGRMSQQGLKHSSGLTTFSRGAKPSVIMPAAMSMVFIFSCSSLLSETVSPPKGK